MNLALSVSHCPQSRLTFALLLGLSDAQQAFILDQLKSPGIVPHAAHPLLLPVLLTCHHEALLHERARRKAGRRACRTPTSRASGGASGNVEMWAVLRSHGMFWA